MIIEQATVYVCEHCGTKELSARGILHHEFDCIRKPNRDYHAREVFGDTPGHRLTPEQRAWSDDKDARRKAYIEAGLKEIQND